MNEENLYKTLIEAVKCFNAFINDNNELILLYQTNRYIDLNRTKDVLTFKAKVLEYVIRDCVKTQVFNDYRENEKFYKSTLKKLNKFLCTSFTLADCQLIYDRLGNGINRGLTEKFIESEYDLNILRKGEETGI